MKPIKPNTSTNRPNSNTHRQGNNQGNRQGKPSSSSTVSQVKGQAPSSTDASNAKTFTAQNPQKQQIPKSDAPNVTGSVSGQGTKQSEVNTLGAKLESHDENAKAFLVGRESQQNSKQPPEPTTDLIFEVYRKEHEGKLVGRFVKNDTGDEFYVAYSYNDGLTHLVHGYGKRLPFVIADESIELVGTEKVELVLSRLFNKRYTYLTDGNCLFMVERFGTNYNVSVCAYANAVTRWFEVQESASMLYQLPHTKENDKATVHVLLAADEKPSPKHILDTVKAFKLDATKPTDVINVKDLEPIDEDFMSDTFTINFY